MESLKVFLRQYGETIGTVIIFVGLFWAHPGLALAAGGVWLADGSPGL